MKQGVHQGGWIIFFSFVIALALVIMPLPDALEMIRPGWVAIVLIYWCMALPARVGVGIGWLAGLFTDVLHASLLGQHALTLALIAFLTLKLHQRIRVFPLWQQAVTVFVLMMFQATISLWIRGMLGESPSLWQLMLPALTTALVWPPSFILLRHVRRLYQVS